MFELTFHGAARTVTGSCHLLELNGKRILLDCGLYQGHRAEALERNKDFPFDPKAIDVLVLSHAHIDHSGKIPMLVKNGFTGPIYCTPATRDLANVMLMDSANIQEKDAEFVNKKHARKGLDPVEPLYNLDDALRSIEQFQSFGYRRSNRITENIQCTFYDAGHILGSALVVLDLVKNGSTHRFCFSGDIGRPNRPILRDPDFVGDVDSFICESTYGGRFHTSERTALETLEDVIKRTLARGGKIIVPAFSVGRTQELVYDLHELASQGRLPRFPIFVDSPLSVDATQVFRIHPECLDESARAHLLERDDPFGFEQLRYITKVSDSKKLNDDQQPMMIISSSGMCEAGRILHHLANNIEEKKNTVLITGYNAEHTLGRRIVERNPVVKIFGDDYKLNAEVVVMNSLSAHADRTELLSYCEQFERNRLSNIFLVHGDYDQQQKLQSALVDEQGFQSVHIPEQGQKFTI